MYKKRKTPREQDKLRIRENTNTTLMRVTRHISSSTMPGLNTIDERQEAKVTSSWGSLHPVLGGGKDTSSDNKNKQKGKPTRDYSNRFPIKFRQHANRAACIYPRRHM